MKKSLILTSLLGVSLLSANEIKVDYCDQGHNNGRVFMSTAIAGAFGGVVAIPVGLVVGALSNEIICDKSIVENKKDLTEDKINNQNTNITNLVSYENENSKKTIYLKSEDIQNVDDFAFFGFDKSKIDKNTIDKSKLKELEKIKNNQEYTINVIGFASEPGSNEYNKKLSEKRAINVSSFLKKEGYNNKISIEAKGEEELKYKENKLNQRVDLELKKIKIN